MHTEIRKKALLCEQEHENMETFGLEIDNTRNRNMDKKWK